VISVSKNARQFVVTDSDGYISIVRNALKIRSRVRVGADIKQMVSVNSKLIVLQPKVIAFLIENKLSPGFCEIGNTGKEFVSMAIETFRAKQNYIYALTTEGSIAVFKYSLPGSGQQQNECELKSLITLPQAFITPKIVIASLRGSLLLQNQAN
jgi:hypothetical protein